MKYDKPRITSTIIIGVILTVLLVFTLLLTPVSWAALKGAIDESAENSESAGGQIVGAFALAIVGAVGIALVIAIYFLIIIGNGICFIFTFKNRRSTLKPIRIISFVMDGLIGVMVTISIVKIILLFCGI